MMGALRNWTESRQDIDIKSHPGFLFNSKGPEGCAGVLGGTHSGEIKTQFDAELSKNSPQAT